MVRVKSDGVRVKREKGLVIEVRRVRVKGSCLGFLGFAN
jgi:hypothetical protein